MRGTTASFGFGSIDVLVRALLDEFPELDRKRLLAAIERARAKAASAALNTEGHRFIDLHLSLAEASQESSERARILRDLSENLELERGDADRAFVVRLAAFSDAPKSEDLEPLLRLAQLTQRWGELPLDPMLALVKIEDDTSPKRLAEMAAAWQHRGEAYRAADCYERVLALVPGDLAAHEALELFYRSTGEWGMLIDLLGRRANHVENKERAELLREMALIYERELGDDQGALDAYSESDQLQRDHPDVLDGIARLRVRLGLADEEALAALERLGKLVNEPKKRAAVLFQAADIAKHHDYDKAQSLYEAARTDDPDLIPAIDGLAVLLRDRGDLAGVIALLESASARPALASERSRWLADAGDFCVALADTEHARQLYHQAREADPTNHKAGSALVELCWDTGSLAELVPILDELIRTTQDPTKQRTLLLQRSKVASQLGDVRNARETLSRAVDLDSHDPATRRELADMLFENQEWARARKLIEGLLEDREDMLQPEVSIELHYRVARCARELGDNEGAAKHAAVTLALSPEHRPALLLRAELAVADPDTQLADQLALANSAPPDEKGPRFAALGDRYAELGDRATAREMYREALQHRADDHLVLTKFLGLVADEGDWSYSLDLVRRLIDTEQDRKVRARYRNLAAQIARDELHLDDDAAALFDQAIEDDPLLFTAADELEAMLAVARDREPLVAFYYRRLGHVRDDEGRSGERLRLWDRLGELCLQLGRREDAIVAFQVGLSLDPEDLERRQRLADLLLEAEPKHLADAIALHQSVLRGNKRRVASYEALRTLYRQAGQPEHARACDDALAIIGMHVVDERIDALFGGANANEPRGASRALSNEDWLALSRIDVELQLSALYALVAPAFAAERARLRPPPALPPKLPEVPGYITRVIATVAAVFGIPVPAVLIDRDQPAACTMATRTRDAVLVPALVIGRPALDNMVDDRELAFAVARQLADLRNDRIARLFCPRAGDLTQIIELAASLTATTEGARWLSTALHPLELDQVRTLGARLRERAIDPGRSALDWLAATERAADRIGFVVVGDLATCVRVLERDVASPDRGLELVWSSVTAEVLAVRGRVEGWIAAADVISSVEVS